MPETGLQRTTIDFDVSLLLVLEKKAMRRSEHHWPDGVYHLYGHRDGLPCTLHPLV